MTVTLNGIDIETVIDIQRRQIPMINKLKQGFRSMSLPIHLKNTEHDYEVTGVWTAGDPDYDSKEAKVQNLVDAGLPVWLEAVNWRKNGIIFGRPNNLVIGESDGKADVSEFRFLMSAVPPWGYIFIQTEPSNTTFQIYDLDKTVQSKDLNPLLRRCSYTKTSTQITFSIFVKNTGSLSGDVILEMFVPDGVVFGNITATGWTIAVGIVGTAGYSSFPGSKNRVKLTKTIAANVETQLDVTIAFGTNTKTSFIDGSIDETAA